MEAKSPDAEVGKVGQSEEAAEDPIDANVGARGEEVETQGPASGPGVLDDDISSGIDDGDDDDDDDEEGSKDSSEEDDDVGYMSGSEAERYERRRRRIKRRRRRALKAANRPPSPPVFPLDMQVPDEHPAVVRAVEEARERIATELKDAIWQKQRALEKLKAANLRFSTQRDELDKQVARLSAELRDANSKAVHDRVDVQNDKAALYQRILRADSRADGYAQTIDQLKGERANDAKRMREQQQAMTKVTDERNDLKWRLGETEKERDSARETILLNKEHHANMLREADERRVKELERKDQEIRRLNKEWEGKLAEADARCDAETRRCIELQGSLESKQVELETKSRILEGARMQLEDTFEALRSTKIDLQDSRDQLEVARSEIEAREQDIRDLEGAMKAAEAQHASNVRAVEAEWKGELSKRQETLTSLQNEVERLRIRTSGLETTTERLTQQKEKLLSEKEAAEETKDQALKTIKRKEGELYDMRGQMAKTNKTLAETKTQLINTKTTLLQTKTQLSETVSERDKLESNLSNSRATVADLKSTVSTLEQQVRAQQVEVDTATRAVQNMKMQTAIEASQSSAKVESAEQAKKKLADQVKSLSSKNTKLDRSLRDATTAKLTAEETLSAASKQLRSLKAELKLAKEQIKNLTASRDSLANDKLTLTNSNAKLQKTVDHAKTALKKAMTAAKSAAAAGNSIDIGSQFETASVGSGSVFSLFSNSKSGDPTAPKWGPTGAVALYRRRADELQHQLETIHPKITEYAGRVEVLEAETQHKDKLLASLEADLATAKQRTLEVEAADQVKLADAVARERAKYEPRISSLQGEVRVLTKLMSPDQAATMAALRAELDPGTQELVHSLIRTVEFQEGKLHEVERRLESLRDRLGDSVQSPEHRPRTSDGLHPTCVGCITLREKLRDARATIRSLKERARDMHREIRLLKRDLKDSLPKAQIPSRHGPFMASSVGSDEDAARSRSRTSRNDSTEASLTSMHRSRSPPTSGNRTRANRPGSRSDATRSGSPIRKPAPVGSDSQWQQEMSEAGVAFASDGSLRRPGAPHLEHSRRGSSSGPETEFAIGPEGNQDGDAAGHELEDGGSVAHEPSFVSSISSEMPSTFAPGYDGSVLEPFGASQSTLLPSGQPSRVSSPTASGSLSFARSPSGMSPSHRHGSGASGTQVAHRTSAGPTGSGSSAPRVRFPAVPARTGISKEADSATVPAASSVQLSTSYSESALQQSRSLGGYRGSTVSPLRSEESTDPDDLHASSSVPRLPANPYSAPVTLVISDRERKRDRARAFARWRAAHPDDGVDLAADISTLDETALLKLAEKLAARSASRRKKREQTSATPDP